MVLAFDKGGASLQSMIDGLKQVRNITQQDTAASLALERAWQSVGTQFVGTLSRSKADHRMDGKRAAGGGTRPSWDDPLRQGRRERQLGRYPGLGQAPGPSVGLYSCRAGRSSPPRHPQQQPREPTARWTRSSVSHGRCWSQGNVRSTRALRAKGHQYGVGRCLDLCPSIGERHSRLYCGCCPKQTGFGANQQIDLGDPYTRSLLMQAMVQHENGMNPYSAGQFAAASGQRPPTSASAISR